MSVFTYNNSYKMHAATCLQVQMLKRMIKMVFMVSMLILNILYVARPTIEKYLEKGIMIEVSTVSPEYVVAPAVTFIKRGFLQSDG